MRYLPGATPYRRKRPRLSVCVTRSNGSVWKAESARLRCRPTSIPFTGSRLSACSTVPATCMESMSGPVENVYVKFPSGLPSLLSTMASPKSTVYVVLGFSESASVTSTRRPLVFTSGASSCGGDTMTFSEAFSSLIISSNSRLMRLRRLLLAPGRGEALTKRGGVSSYGPPSGDPGLAQAAKTAVSTSGKYL